MKTEIVYFSKTGHSKKIAQAIAAELHLKERDIKTNPELSGADLLFVVGGIYGGASDPAMLEYVKGIGPDKAKKAALVTSCCGGKAKQDKVRELLANNGVEVIADEFVCRGNFLVVGLGHPDKNEIAAAAAFAKKIVDSAER